ncbi:MAG: hypothetical protein DHS20C14_00640 [Phycisphaeraceae bacterium]|nr:MAG: hypothetical protein DHS20C14_00640 [Phycisphaeraceae bacterium]
MTRRRFVRPLSALAAALAVVSTCPLPAPAQDTPAPTAAATPDEVVLQLTNGRVIQGLLVGQSRDDLTIRVNGVDIAILRRNVQGVRTLPPVMERYQAMRRAIEPDDTGSLIILAGWLRDRGLYAEALAEIEPVVRLEPFNTEAKDLERWLRAQIALERGRAARTEPEDEPDTDAPARTRPRPARTERERRPIAADRFPVLTPEQINTMRVYEVDMSDPPRMRVDRAAVEEFMRAYAGADAIPGTQAGRERLLLADASDVLALMFRLQARDFYPRVQVLEDPDSIVLFKRNVHGTGGWFTNACASARCHGGEHAGRLYLNTRRPNSDATVYTNLLILDQFTLADGTALIDYARPARSPLLHMALERDISLYPHPEVPGRGGLGWRPVFRSTQERAYERTVEWISSMYSPRIGYPIDYTPPTPEPEPSEDPDDAPSDPDEANPPDISNRP